MKDKLKKVVILDNLASPYVRQAIIVMRDYNPKLESKAVIEAERIVSAYLDNMKTNYVQSSKKTVRKGKSMFTAFIMSAISAITVYVIMRYRI